jgi:hypothetical protein
MAPHQDTQTHPRPIIGEDGPSDSALLVPCARAAPLGAIRPRGVRRLCVSSCLSYVAELPFFLPSAYAKP